MDVKKQAPTPRSIKDIKQGLELEPSDDEEDYAEFLAKRRDKKGIKKELTLSS